MIETRDWKGAAQMVYKHWLGGSAMEEILMVGKAAPIVAGLLEAMRNGMRIEADAQTVLTSAPQSLRLAIAEAFEAEAAELSLTCDEGKERQARFLQSLASRMSWKPKVKAQKPTKQPKLKPEQLQAVLDRELARGDTKAAAKAIAEARLVDEKVIEGLEKLQDIDPELARVLAVNLRRRARKESGGKSRFLHSLAMRTEPKGVTQLPQRKQSKRQAA
ncbi:MAG: hypothetical protein P1P90_04675 [Patescibacteria group bacterium]|nr:hypothetical protein [Patescibacteria group bacterium]